MIDVGDALERVVEIAGEQRCHHAKAHEADTHVESRLERLAEFHSDAQTDDGEENRHHHRRAQTDYITKYLFH